MRLIPKRWGKEEILFSGAYLFKRLTLDPNSSTSMHWHYAKCETLYVVQGCLFVDFESSDHVVEGEFTQVIDSTYLLGPGKYMTIREGRVNAHRMYTMSQLCVYLEASTPQECDSERCPNQPS